MFKNIQSQIDGLINAYTIERSMTPAGTRPADLLKALSKIKLFTAAHASAKMSKNLKFKQFETYILYMSPADLAFKELGRKGTLCPFASEGCKAACLNTAGRGRFDSVAQARLRKALYFITQREAFVKHVFSEVGKLRAKLKRGKKLVIRLNGTTDLNWIALTHAGKSIFDTYSDVQFYDYTKNLQYALKSQSVANYHVTFSASESNDVQWQAALGAGLNVAMVFASVPQTYHGVKVVNGDDHDLRFLDKNNGSGLIVGLTAKGKAKRDTSGFVKQTSCSKAA